MKFIVKPTEEMVAYEAANMIEEAVKAHPTGVIGLATGSSPMALYEELARRNHQENLDFSRIRTLQLDEYVGLAQEDSRSYNYYLHEHIVRPMNMNPLNCMGINGKAKNPEEEASRHENKIFGLDEPEVQILGVGVNGHIGFNEPESVFQLKTHVVQLTEDTKNSNAPYFKAGESVPDQAITLGMEAILRAKKILLLALGEKKTEALGSLAKDVVDPMIPITILKTHPNVVIFADEAAAANIPKEWWEERYNG